MFCDRHEIDFYRRLGYIPASAILFLERYCYGESRFEQIATKYRFDR
ncbi:hypothetical protein SAMN05660420_01184 [Desulfuromusa kysingii]|uniref:Uncharacterized protein n=1 Tax=Desulfuromusa kysingii TaxID=37625 RepID=A0A1H3YE97_9BACT|nr:hypothetical protein SAMN05660420_01184 [Desulfuromusa kysingii]